MKKYTSVHDVADLNQLVEEAQHLKKNPYKYKTLGENKTLGLIFLNPSLRTRLSTQKAGQNLGMNVIVMNLDKEGWALETQEGAIMNGSTVEHIKEAAAVMGEYCDIIGIRSFPKLQNREEDYNEELLGQFIKYSQKPIVSLESATRHPLQSLADLLTIKENAVAGKRPKVVLSWAPHIKPIPQCVANSFAEWMGQADVELVITHPKGYELADEFTKNATVTTNQQEALKGADFVYVKNWSSYTEYGKVLTDGEGWMLTNEKLQVSNNAKVMHCLPVRRNVELSDEILDGPNSLVLEQANNRTYAAQAVLKRMLEAL
ncbi:acetylornithine carbamoyltransferase [Pontibacter litorisediminis]|uniref:acetylornithine carbamoyltransferase n=1 Tax=Pontibacter litorisediminis TaxID=1846260 RepID=UPI0023EBEC05|nr:acetylornithine carbamoyltransferase [Pontibacter litorisediminis]